MPEEMNRPDLRPDPTKDEGSLIEQAKKLDASIRAQNDRHEALIQREEKLHAEQLLGGHSTAGQAPEPPHVETDKEYSQRMLRGGK